jgi:xylitol oxidase
MVRGLRLVEADGGVADLTRGVSPDFDGSVVALGALGVVTELTVDIVPTFDVAQYVHQGVALDTLIDRFEEVFSAGYSVSAFTDWRGDASVWVKSTTGSDAASGAEPGWLGGLLAEHAAHPIPGMSAENSTEQLGIPGPWHERLPHFRPDFTPSAGEELQSEFFVPRAQAAEALNAVRELGSLIGPVVQISEVRTVAADELWLSPSYRRDSVTLHFTWVPDLAAVTPALAAIERELSPLGARPHWGKVFSGGPAAALAGYERAADFQALADRRDPGGKFRNAFVRRLFPVGAED